MHEEFPCIKQRPDLANGFAQVENAKACGLCRRCSTVFCVEHPATRADVRTS